MADQFQQISVPNVGVVNFPTSMNDDQIHDAIVKNYPDIAARQKAKADFGNAVTPMLDPFKSTGLPSLAPTTKNPTPEYRQSQAYLKGTRLSAEQEFNPKGAFPLQPVATAQQAPSALNSLPSRSGAREQAARAKAIYLPGATEPNGYVQQLGEDTADAYKQTFGKSFIQKYLGDPANVDLSTAVNQALAERQPRGFEPGDSTAAKLAKGAGRGLFGAAEGLSTPENLILGAGMAAAPESVLARLAGAGFTAQMGYAGATGAKQTYEDIKRGEYGQAAEHGVGTGINLGFAGLGALHMLHDKTAGAVPAETPETTSVAPAPSTVEATPNPTPFGERLQQAMSNPRRLSSDVPATVPTLLDTIGQHIEAGTQPVSREALEQRVLNFETSRNLDRDTLVGDIQKKGPRATPDEKQFLTDYFRLKQTPAGFPRASYGPSGIATPETMVAPEAAPEAPVPAKLERRQDSARRQLVENMSPEEMRKSLLTSEKVDLPNKRAFDEAQAKNPAPAIGFSDVDGLKALNDTYGHDAGDALLRAKGEALKEAGLDSYHSQGDEFIHRGDNAEDLQAKLAQASQILQKKVIEFKDKDGNPVKVMGADFSHGIAGDVDTADKAMLANKDQRQQAGLRGARGEMGNIREVKAAVKTPEAPVTTPTPHQAQNPSSVEHESVIRKLVGSLIRTKQLQASAKDRLNVSLALKNAGSQFYDEDSKKWVSSGQPIEPQQLDSVSRALGVNPDSIREQNYHLTDPQIKQLTDMLKAGKKTVDLDASHPEQPFAPKGLNPLAEINENSLRAAGLPSPKDRFALLTDKEKAGLKRFRSQTVGTQSEADAMESGSQTKGRGWAVEGGQVSKGRDAETLQFEHDLAQKVLERRLKQTLDSLKEAIPAWQKSREGATAPSELSQQVASLSGRLRQSIPRELYAQEHLSAKATPSTETSIVAEPVQRAETPKVEQASQAPVGESQPKSPSGKALIKGITELADKIETHGDEAFGALPNIFSAVSEKYKLPDNVNRALYGVMKKYEANLREGVEEPLKKALADTLDKYPAEKGDATLYSNPIGPAISALFGRKRAALVMQASTGPLSLPESPIAEFTKALDQRANPDVREAFGAFLKTEVGKIGDFVNGIPKFTVDSLAKVGDLTKAAWHAYTNRGGLSPLEWSLGYRRLELSSNALVMHAFAEKMQRLHPDASRREAMVNYLQASGGVMSDRDVNAQLQFKANQYNAVGSRENARLKQGYIDAQTLTDSEKQTVDEYRAYDKYLNQQEAAQGLELHARENYIRQIWSRDSLARKQIDAIFSAGMFSVNPNFTKLRTFEDYFEGEQAGFTPHRKDFAYLVSARARASAEVLANRSLIQNLYNEVMPDGGKLAQIQGIGTEVTKPNPTDADKVGALVVKQARPSDAIAADGRPYVVVNHPSFQNWKWVGSAPDGTPTLYKGSMLVHPDVAPQLKRILEKSALRDNPIGAAALKASSIGKQTLLIGLFHPVQLAVHFLEHAAENPTTTTAQSMKTLNPFSKSIINLDNAIQQKLVIHGLKIADFNAESMWDEGVMSRGMANGMPLVGGFLRNMHDAMFLKYIPNIKMGMALDALNRNMDRYGNEYTKQELGKLNGPANQADFGRASLEAQSRVYRMTAEQMNAAFGGINWDALPINRTWQDMARLTVLAPDFLLARMQFVGDALRPGGSESRRALLLGAFVQYTAARAFNTAMNDGDGKWDIHDWNKFVVGRHEYSLRTVQGDLMDSILDTRRFIEHRMNPITLRPLAEAYTGKDVFGHPASAGQQLYDFAKNIVPMPLQGIADAFGSKIDHSLRQGKHDEQISDTIIQSLGLQRRQYRTPAERLVYQAFDDIQAPPSQDDLTLEQKNTFRYMREQYREGKLTPGQIQKSLQDGSLKASEAKYLFKTRTETRLVSEARQLQPNQVLTAWAKGTPMEKFELGPLAFSKIRSLPPQLQMPAYQRISQWISTLPKDKLQGLAQKTQDEIEYEYPQPVQPEQPEKKEDEDQ